MAEGFTQKGKRGKEIAELKASNRALQGKVEDLGSRLAMHLGVDCEDFWLEEAASDMEEVDEE